MRNNVICQNSKICMNKRICTCRAKPTRHQSTQQPKKQSVVLKFILINKMNYGDLRASHRRFRTPDKHVRYCDFSKFCIQIVFSII